MPAISPRQQTNRPKENKVGLENNVNFAVKREAGANASHTVSGRDSVQIFADQMN